jgi:glyoxylase-like metal-dependent hydrolase (beta-lactamase superfamily II)
MPPALLDTPPPGPGQAVPVAPGVLWLRLPLPMALNHVNVYALEDPDGWTLIDAGLDWDRGRAAWDAALAGPLAGRPVARVILTHHHPDHVGCAARFAAMGARILAPRTAWLYARMLTLDHNDRPTPQALAFLRRAGWPEPRLAAYAAAEPFNFSRCVQPLPPGFASIRDGQTLRIGGRDWTARLTGGHAPDHLTLWSADGELALVGDQILPRITPNIGVHAAEPEADPLSDFLSACARLAGLTNADRLALPGHERPFRGLPDRLAAMADDHLQALDRIMAALAAGPRTAVECFEPLFRRPIPDGEYGLATAEAVAHMNHLTATGRATAQDRPDGARRFGPA